MARRSNPSNSPFRVAPLVEPNVPAPEDKKAVMETAVKEKQIQDKAENISKESEETDQAKKAKTTKKNKEKAKLGRKVTIGKGANIRIMFLVDEDMDAELKKYCEENHYTLSVLLREMVNERLHGKK